MEQSEFDDAMKRAVQGKPKAAICIPTTSSSSAAKSRTHG